MSGDGDFYERFHEYLRERIKRRVECGDCKYSEKYTTFAVCLNEESDSYNTPVRLTASCLFGTKN